MIARIVCSASVPTYAHTNQTIQLAIELMRFIYANKTITCFYFFYDALSMCSCARVIQIARLFCLLPL